MATESREIRLRSMGGSFFQTIKSTEDLVRREYEIELSEQQFLKLWPLTAGKRIEKTRYYSTTSKDLIFEVDVYEGALHGLMLLEVEFGSEDDSQEFEVPNWVVREVTFDSRFKNRNLVDIGDISDLG